MAMLFRVKDLDEAIALANDTPFGLAASAWTRDPIGTATPGERAAVWQRLSERHGGQLIRGFPSAASNGPAMGASCRPLGCGSL